MFELKGKKIGIVGFSRTGRASADFVSKRGGIVYVSESNKNLEKELKGKGFFYEIGKNSYEFLKDTDLIIISPGVNSELPFLKQLKKAGKKIVSEIEFSSYFIKGKIIGITGSNGKSTVTSLIYHIFKESGISVEIAGNIGLPFINYVEKDADFFIVELSSFQLENIENFRPYISVLLNITPDHLDRYKSFEEYALAKFNIFKNQTAEDYTVLNREDDFTISNINKIKAKKIFFSIERETDIFLKEGDIVYEGEKIININDIPLIGIHNIENTMAAIGCAKAVGIENNLIAKGIKSFKGLEHRTEKCGEKDGIIFINDSKATNVDATYKALKSFKKGVILILGGKDKGGDFSVLNNIIRERVKLVILIGAAKDKIKSQLDSDIPFIEVKNMKEAVYEGYKRARRDDIILLSPACASFDMYDNFEERGKDFKHCVEELIREGKNG